MNDVDQMLEIVRKIVVNDSANAEILHNLQKGNEFLSKRIFELEKRVSELEVRSQLGRLRSLNPTEPF